MKIEMKKKVWSVIAMIAVCSLLVIGAFYQTTAAENKNKSKMAEAAQEKIPPDGMQPEEISGFFSEEGTTQAGSVSQMPAFSVSAVTMTVKEVYHASGDTVTQGDALLQISEESMLEAAAYYESAVAEAERTLKLAQADLTSGDLDAWSKKKETSLTAQSAAERYQAAVNKIDAEVAEKKASYEETAAEIQKYQEEIENGTYYTTNGLSEKKDAQTLAETEAADAQTKLETAQKEAQEAALSVGSCMTELKAKIESGTDSAALSVLSEKMITAYELLQNTISAETQAQKEADMAQSRLEQAMKTFEQAVEDYNKDIQEANEKITKLTEQSALLLAEYEEAERNSVVEKVQLKNEWETAKLEGSYAESTYQSAVLSLEETVNEAQKNYETLLEEQAALLAVEDGIITAAQSGTLSYIAYEAGDTLRSGNAVAFYNDSSEITISVEVPQEKIAEVEVGQKVRAEIAGNGRETREGTVSSIASLATTGASLSNVTYTVVISIDNEDGTLSAGSSAVVLFTTGEEKER